MRDLRGAALDKLGVAPKLRHLPASKLARVRVLLKPG